MYEIKRIPEDFIVREIPNLKLDENGNFSYFKLIKRDLNTIQAIDLISKKFNIQSKNIKFAGNKDKKAITEQFISIFNLNKTKKNQLIELNSKNTKKFCLENFCIEIEFIGKGSEPISLGDLKGNEFEIVVRNLNKDIDLIKLKKVPNYFGEQRFSKNNAEIGKAIIKRDFKKGADLILKNQGYQEKLISEILKENKNDYINALKKLNKKILLLYIHAYQSYLFNSIAESYLKNKNINKIKNIKMPLIGFSFDLNEIKDIKLKEIIEKILLKEKLSPRDFIIREMPELSSEGAERDLFMEIEELKIGKMQKDELNEKKFKLKINFKLKKGRYATVVVKELFGH